MRKIKKALYLVIFNFKSLFAFELIYKLLSAAVAAPLLGAVCSAVMELTGYPYLTTENIWRFLRNPAVILFIFFLLGLFCVYSLIDITAIIFLLDQSYHRRKVSLYQTVKFTAKNIARMRKRSNLLQALIVFFILPFLNVGVTVSFVATIPLPGFIVDQMKRSADLLRILLLAAVVLGVFLLQLIYSFHYFTLEQCSFKDACRRSRELSRKKKWKDTLVLAGVQIFFYLCYAIFVALSILLMMLLKQLLAQLRLFNMVTLSTVWGILVVILLIVTALGTPIGYVCISALYYSHRESKKEDFTVCPAEPEPAGEKAKKRIRMAEIALLVLSIVGTAIFVYNSSAEKLNPQVEYLRTMEVTAHRGASAYYPENTMAAFQGAVEMGADWIELDVQQSRDGEIFVMHDRNFNRTAGLNKNTWEMDWTEIAALDVGSHFGETFAGERVPLLAEVLEFAKENNIRLNIELKPSGHETDFEKNVIDVILEADFLDRCVLTSWNYEVLENVKACCEEAMTVYVMGIAIGNVNRLAAADSFSMEASNVTPSMVSRVHNAGKQIYAWTVNTRRSIKRMIDLNVDNIITDKVLLAQECIYENKTSNIIQMYVDFLQRK